MHYTIRTPLKFQLAIHQRFMRSLMSSKISAGFFSSTALAMTALGETKSRLPNEPGALFKALSAFALRGIDLTKLESRPIPSAPFTYRFYVDVIGHAASEPFQQALTDVAGLTTELRILGTYPADQR